MYGVGAVLGPLVEEREDVLVDDLVHLLGVTQVLEVTPPEVGIGAAGSQFVGGEPAAGKDRRLDGLAGTVGLVLGQRLTLVEALDEQQVGELLHHLQRVGDSA